MKNKDEHIKVKRKTLETLLLDYDAIMKTLINSEDTKTNRLIIELVNLDRLQVEKYLGLKPGTYKIENDKIIER